jgi:hypothetical protein
VQSNGFLQTHAKGAKGVADKRVAEKEQNSKGQDRKAQMPIVSFGRYCLFGAGRIRSTKPILRLPNLLERREATLRCFRFPRPYRTVLGATRPISELPFDMCDGMLGVAERRRAMLMADSREQDRLACVTPGLDPSMLEGSTLNADRAACAAAPAKYITVSQAPTLICIPAPSGPSLFSTTISYLPHAAPS